MIATDPLLLQDVSQTEDHFGKFSNQALLSLCVTIDSHYFSTFNSFKKTMLQLLVVLPLLAVRDLQCKEIIKFCVPSKE